MIKLASGRRRAIVGISDVNRSIFAVNSVLISNFLKFS